MHVCVKTYEGYNLFHSSLSTAQVPCTVYIRATTAQSTPVNFFFCNAKMFFVGGWRRVHHAIHGHQLSTADGPWESDNMAEGYI